MIDDITIKLTTSAIIGMHSIHQLNNPKEKIQF